MKRDECFEVLAKHRTSELVVCTIGVMGRDWCYFSPSELNFESCGAMGMASSIGLGLALAQPQRKVMVLDGDGALLMNLGTLATIAGAAPPNLIHFVLENEAYESCGGQPLVNPGRVSFATIARGAGIQKVHEIEQLEDFQKVIPHILKEEGPVFVVLKATKGDTPVPRRQENPVEQTIQFKKAVEKASS
ncbi:MAG: thiamine pyrophosphate-binding protein [Chloroflexi bacterium]|nr:thiamine pyrophosphate-binding protein [Chloroflexota bacterium]